MPALTVAAALAAVLLTALTGALPARAAHPMSRSSADNPTYHGNPQRTGWYDAEPVLTPKNVAGPSFHLLWESAPLDSAGAVPPRLFASPLYVERVQIERAATPARALAVVFAASTTGYVYAISAAADGAVAAGTILWRVRLTDAPCSRGTNGILATPVIDLAARRLYVTACDSARAWRVHALDLHSGRELQGWPLDLAADAINRPGVNANGANRFPAGVANLQRGALNLSPDRSRLFVTFGGEPVSGWIIAVDTRRIRIASAFSMTARTEEGVGGLWASGGAAVDARGDVYVATGSSVINALAGKGAAGVYPDSDGNWGQSILRLSIGRSSGFRLAGTYTPFNYCRAGAQDIDLGAGSPVLIDLDPGSTTTPRLLALGGSKQGNAYLLDRDRMPGGLVRRQPCADDPSRDGSLLGPNPQPQFNARGPLNVFGPYTERFGMGDLAKSRSTSAYFRSASGRHYLFVTGSAKAAEDSGVSAVPGLARLAIVAAAGESAYLDIDAVQQEIVFQNPGSPVVSSLAGRHGIVWVLDVNKPRSASLYGDDPPKPLLYAIDAETLALLWKSEPGQLHPGGKYNEPVVARGTVFVGTDRIQAFGLQSR
jgi:hypothetical protein